MATGMPPNSSPPSDEDATQILPAHLIADLLAKQESLARSNSAALANDSITSMPVPVVASFPNTQSLQSLEKSPQELKQPHQPASQTDRLEAINSNSSLLSKGAKVAEFEIVRLIGQGGFGVVYEAWDHALERVVAIKEYMPTSLANRQADGTIVPLSVRHKETFDAGMRSFINEARLLAQFDHPALLKVYRFWQERGTTYMVMPLYQGQTLKEALIERKGKINEDWLIDIIDGVSQALAVMHAADCYHRDIAPDNIMLLHPNGQPVVLDFGAARRVITDMTQAITVILKPGYAPIEQYSETPDMKQGAWTDVYALCAVMYAAVTGYAPPPAVARMINDRCVPLATDASLREQFSLPVLQAIDAGLTVKPEQRLQSMAALRQALGLSVTSVLMGSAQTRPMSPSNIKHGLPNSNALSNARHPKRVSWWIGGGLGIVSLLGAVLWWGSGSNFRDSSRGKNASVPLSSAPSSASSAPTVAVVPVAPVAQAVAAKTPLDSLISLTNGADISWQMSAKPNKDEVQIGKDKLGFQIQSTKAGFAYVYLLSSSGDLYLLFPNAIDKRHQISANTELSLPRTSWAMDAGGPAGVNEFLVLISDHEMDMASTGFRFDGVFGKFPVNVLAAMEATRGTSKSPLLGTPICPQGNACSVNYGAVRFKITEK